MRILPILVTLLAGAAAWAQPGSSGPEVLGRSFVQAVNSKTLERRVDLVHPKSRACMNASTEPFFSWIFSRQMNYVIPEANYKVSSQPLGPMPSPPGLDFPVQPTQQIQIDFDTAPNSGITVVLFAARVGDRWYEVLACPRPEAVAAAQRTAVETARQQETARNVASQIPDAMRSEILTLAQAGQRIDAIKRAATATGGDLAIARSVVELLAAANSRKP